jgi:outer membrane lipoprotein SlyB
MGLMINSPVGGGQGKWVADAAATIKATLIDAKESVLNRIQLDR